MKFSKVNCFIILFIIILRYFNKNKKKQDIRYLAVYSCILLIKNCCIELKCKTAKQLKIK